MLKDYFNAPIDQIIELANNDDAKAQQELAFRYAYGQKGVRWKPQEANHWWHTSQQTKRRQAAHKKNAR